MISKKITEHFSFDGDKRIICSCCQKIMITDIFWKHMEMLEEVRMELGWPIIVNSGYRCLEYNTKIKGSEGSWHMIFATDVRPITSPFWEPDNVSRDRLKDLIKIAKDLGFTGIGTYDTFVHLDTRPKFTTWRG